MLELAVSQNAFIVCHLYMPLSIGAPERAQPLAAVAPDFGGSRHGRKGGLATPSTITVRHSVTAISVFLLINPYAIDGEAL
jgi:hypothetical protein